MQSGRPGEARLCLREALSLQPDCPEALHCLAELALQDENLEDAYDKYCTLIESGHADPLVYYNTALLCQKRGLLSDAISLYRRALDLDPGFGDAMVNLGHALLSASSADEAAVYFDRAVKVNSELAGATA